MFFFNLVDDATFDFARQFYQQARNTNLAHHKIPKVKIEVLKDDIEKTIDIWEKTIRNSSIKERPN
jgi:hypothetical protein